ncbi:hypothetical protein HK096_001259, partial [Nowakowskiella sp. JEL0078]
MMGAGGGKPLANNVNVQNVQFIGNIENSAADREQRMKQIEQLKVQLKQHQEIIKQASSPPENDKIPLTQEPEPMKRTRSANIANISEKITPHNRYFSETTNSPNRSIHTNQSLTRRAQISDSSPSVGSQTASRRSTDHDLNMNTSRKSSTDIPLQLRSRRVSEDASVL